MAGKVKSFSFDTWEEPCTTYVRETYTERGRFTTDEHTILIKGDIKGVYLVNSSEKHCNKINVDLMR